MPFFFQVCKYALVSFCPHDLFINTRADLGPCNKIHDEELRKQYEKSSRYGKIGFEDEFEDFVRGLLTDVEKRIRRGKERLRLTQSDLANQVTLSFITLSGFGHFSNSELRIFQENTGSNQTRTS